MIKIAVFALVALVLIVFLRQHRNEYALVTAILAGGLMLIFLIVQLSKPLFTLIEMLEKYDVEKGHISYILKSLGICIITKFSTDLCNDFGQTSLSTKVEMAGKIALLVLSLPILQNILEVGLALL